MRRWIGAIVGVGLLGLVACAEVPPGAAPSVAPQPDRIGPACNRVAVRTCALPFPSDQWTVADPSTATGRRVVMPNGVIARAARAELPRALSPSNVFAGADGFSADTPVILETVEPIDPASLPADGGDAFQVWDTTTGERVQILTEPDVEANLRGAANTVLTAWPRVRYEFGHHYLAILTTALQTTDQQPVTRGTRAARALRRPSSAVASSLSFLAERRVKADNVVALTDFTVRSNGNVRTPLDEMMEKAKAFPHAARNLQVIPNLLGVPGVETFVTGQIEIIDFRDRKSGAINFSAPGAGHGDWVDFLLAVPQSAGEQPAPVVIYGHGLGVFKETALLVVGQNAQLGAATFAIDAPNHGSRSDNDGGQIFDLIAPKNTDRLISIITEATVDLTSVRAALETQFAQLDTAPFNLSSPTAADGAPDLDVDRISYQVTSMGAVLGATYVANDPDLDSALFQVGGVGVMNILTHSSLWTRNDIGADKPPFRALVPRTATAGESAVFIALAQMRLDPGDAVNYVDQIPANGTPTLLVYDANDQVVPNRSSDALIALAGLTPTAKVTPGASQAVIVPTDDVTPYLHGPIPLVNTLATLATHVAFIGGGAQAQVDWLRFG